ncbi:unnamed protein product [Cylindrotheca closterium]|uniref:Uncharacterized protein n=1 Tax=Cylindrotheca closterium TaxID=2856 RepID=A0AAD2G792_9STRA|nr:unnamed protein product [Cylindrotheca closterium]
MEAKIPKPFRGMIAWILLICFEIINVNALLPLDTTVGRNCNVFNRVNNAAVPPYYSLPVPMCLCSTPLDDDDISQHETMASYEEGQQDEPTTTNKSTEKKTGYRRIEDWHEETISKNPKHVLTRLQQEKAMWDKKFEDLGGDGI